MLSCSVTFKTIRRKSEQLPSKYPRIEIPGQIRSGKLVIPELPMWGYFNWTRTDKCIFVTGQDRFQMGWTGWKAGTRLESSVFYWPSIHPSILQAFAPFGAFTLPYRFWCLAMFLLARTDSSWVVLQATCIGIGKLHHTNSGHWGSNLGPHAR